MFPFSTSGEKGLGVEGIPSASSSNSFSKSGEGGAFVIPSLIELGGEAEGTFFVSGTRCPGCGC